MNTIECKPYNGRFSSAACAAFQKQGRAGCPCAGAVQGVEPPKSRRAPGSMAGVNLYIEHGIRIENPATDGGRKKGRPARAKRGENPYSTHFTGRRASTSFDVENPEATPHRPQVRTQEERQEPRAKGQGPRAKGQGPRAKGQGRLKLNSNSPGWCGSHGSAIAAPGRCS